MRILWFLYPYLSLLSLPLPALKDDRFQMVLFTPRLVRIALTNVSVSDEGGYFCQLYTDDTHHQVATLSVVVPPEVPTVEVKTEAVEGGEVELTCVSPRSKPPATLRWVRDRREIAGAFNLIIVISHSMQPHLQYILYMHLQMWKTT